MITQEKNKLDDILKLNETALKQYEILAELEINGKKNSGDYKKVIANLKMIAEVINKKFDSLNITDEELLEFDASLAQKYDYEDEDILLEVLAQNLNNLPAKRLSMQIFNYSLINYCYCIEDEYIAEEFAEYADEVNEMVEEDANREIDFELIKDRLINYTFLAYLEEAIKNETNKEVKEILIKTKYHTLYLLFTIEHNFLRDQDNYGNPQTFKEAVTCQESNVDLEDEFIKPNEETIIEHLKCIASLPNTYYDTLENNVKIYLMSIYIKTLISINISKPTDRRLNALREKLKLKSEKSRKYIDETYNISKRLSVVKKVDF